MLRLRTYNRNLEEKNNELLSIANAGTTTREPSIMKALEVVAQFPNITKVHGGFNAIGAGAMTFVVERVEEEEDDHVILNRG